MGEHSALEETMYIVLSGSVGVAAVRKRLLQAEREGRYGYEEVETQRETVVATIGERFGGLHLDEVTSRPPSAADLHTAETTEGAVGCAGDGRDHAAGADGIDPRGGRAARALRLRLRRHTVARLCAPPSFPSRRWSAQALLSRGRLLGAQTRVLRGRCCRWRWPRCAARRRSDPTATSGCSSTASPPSTSWSGCPSRPSGRSSAAPAATAASTTARCSSSRGSTPSRASS